MYEISAETVIRGDVDAIWAVAIDVDGWPAWDPHEIDARLDGPFAAGVTGWSKPRGGPATTWTITAVDTGRSWSSACPLPGGGLSGATSFEPLPGGRVRCRKVMRVTGPLTILFRVHFGRHIRRDMVATFAALERVAAARTAA